MSTGTIHKFGTICVNDDILLKRPLLLDSTYGDEYKFTSYKYNSELSISDTIDDDRYTLSWVEVNYGNYKYLICDRNLIIDISYDELDRMGLIYGKQIEIDGTIYKIRSLTGGINCPSYNDNEWDMYIGNAINSNKLPPANDEDNLLIHNKLWNWNGIYSICMGNYYNNKNLCLSRGCKSYNSYYAYSSIINNEIIGWRPILECISENSDVLNKNSTFTQIYNKINEINSNLSNEIDRLKTILINKGIDCNEFNTLSSLIDKVDEL